MKNIIWFEDLSEDDLGAAGGKGVNLGRMVNQGFTIPPGFVITSKVYFDFIEDTGIKSEIEKILKDLDVENTENLQDASDEIAELFLKQDIPEGYTKKFLKPFKKLKNDKGIHLAVRSSATAEDLPGSRYVQIFSDC
ncbi:MAG: PEP/pyruvate-binding domain-containing protein [Promethearchaeia archaeon]